MTVRETIERLKEMPQDYEVLVDRTEDYSSLNRDYILIQKTTPELRWHLSDQTAEYCVTL